MAFFGLGVALTGAAIFYFLKEKVEESMLLRYVATFLIIFGLSILILPFLNS